MTSTWIIVAVVAFVLALAAVLLLHPMKASRDPDREGYQDEEASLAYDRTSRGPVFAFERYLVMTALARLKPHGTVADVGSGPGHLAAKISRAFPDLNVIGLDVNPYMVTLANKNRLRNGFGNFELVRADVFSLPFASHSVDLVVSSLSLHHWADPARGLLDVHRVLIPGGKLLLFDLRRDSPVAVYYAFSVGQALFTPKAIRRTNGAVGSLWSSYTAQEVAALLSEAGFENVEVTSRLGWLLAKGFKA